MNRPSKDEYFLRIAQEVATRGTCLRRQYGAVLVDQDGWIVSSGYCGMPSDLPDCTESGHCWRTDHNIPSLQNYDKCYSVHAEINALMQAGKKSRGSFIYLACYDLATNKETPGYPCLGCAKALQNARVELVINRNENSQIVRATPLYYLKVRFEELGMELPKWDS